MSAITRWWWHPAEPWQFWYPMSGGIGGVLLGSLLFIIYCAARVVLAA